MPAQISFKDSVWFFDIDDTLISTSNNDVTLSASESIKNVLLAELTNKDAQKLKTEFLNIFNIMLSGHRGNRTVEYENLLSIIENCQRDIQKEFGDIKRWSREIFLKIAADKNNLKISSQLITRAINAYWKRLSEKTIVLPHVIETIETLLKHNKKIYLITGSDARLILKNNNQFTYDPVFSEKFKQARLLFLKDKGIPYTFACIGDPVDKPHRTLFKKALGMAERDLKIKINPENVIIAGDSYQADLQTPKEKLKFGLCVLFKPEISKTEIIDEHQINVGNLMEIFKFIKN